MIFALVRRDQASRLAMVLAPVVALGCSILASLVLFARLGKPAGLALYSLLLEPFLSWYDFSEVLLYVERHIFVQFFAPTHFTGEQLPNNPERIPTSLVTTTLTLKISEYLTTISYKS